MGAGSLLALMARHSGPPARQHFKLAAGDIALMGDYERPSHILSHAQSAVDEQPGPGAADALHLLLSRFHVDLEERLQQLQLQGTRSVHLNWLLDALASTLSTHSSLRSAFAASAVSSSASSACKHRADEVLYMLDVCTSLKQVADDMDRQFACLQHALQSVGQALNSDSKSLSSSRLRGAAHKLSACLLQEQPHTGLLCITSKQYRPLTEARSSLLLATKSREKPISAATPLDSAAALLRQALDGTLLTSLLVLSAAVSSLAPPSHKKCSITITSICKMIFKHLSAKSVSTLWAAPLRQLHHDLKQEDQKTAGGFLFRELQGLHFAATKLHATIAIPGAHLVERAVVKQSVESLEKSLREVQSCNSVLRMQLASLFQTLIALRLTLLDS